MGTYTELTIDRYSLIESKSAVVPEVMTLFRETDRRKYQQPVVGAPDELETVVEYSCETDKVIERLNVMGFTLRRAREEYEEGRRAEIQQYEEDADWTPDDLDVVKGMDFDTYMASFQTIMRKGLHGYRDEDKSGLDPVGNYILKQHDESLFGYFCSDVRLLVRMACHLAPKGSRVVQDISQLIYSGYYGEDDPVCENATKELTARHPENSSRIIITEGSIDVHVLKDGLSLLYPHLVGYYSFLDFDSSRSPGGAGHLVSLVKAFAGAGITNRIIALFDNDTAAREAAKQLKAVPIPPNILVLHYPDISLLRTYPTLGPSGLVPLDVNGLAGGIELYFGEDILRDEQGNLTPVQWRGYSEAMKKYQGEVTQKTKLLTAFNARVARCRQDSDALKTTDWSGIDGILQTIFRAFD